MENITYISVFKLFSVFSYASLAFVVYYVVYYQFHIFTILHIPNAVHFDSMVMAMAELHKHWGTSISSSNDIQVEKQSKDTYMNSSYTNIS